MHHDPSIWTPEAYAAIASAIGTIIAAGAAVYTVRGSVNVQRESREALARALRPTFTLGWYPKDASRAERRLMFTTSQPMENVALVVESAAGSVEARRSTTRIDGYSIGVGRNIMFSEPDDAWTWLVEGLGELGTGQRLIVQYSDERGVGRWEQSFVVGDEWLVPESGEPRSIS